MKGVRALLVIKSSVLLGEAQTPIMSNILGAIMNKSFNRLFTGLYKVLAIFIFIMTCTSAYAGFSSDLAVKRVRVFDSGIVYFGTSSQPTDTCSNWGEYFQFDHTTAAGKSMLSTLLSAKASSMKVVLWYVESTVPGTNQENGCTKDALSLVTGIGLL